WAEAGISPDLPQTRILISRDALGKRDTGDPELDKRGSPLPPAIFAASSWALERLSRDLRSVDQMCRDICLTGRVYMLGELTYWGVTQPTAVYEECACGS